MSYIYNVCTVVFIVVKDWLNMTLCYCYLFQRQMLEICRCSIYTRTVYIWWSRPGLHMQYRWTADSYSFSVTQSQYIFQDFCIGGVMDKLRVQDFRSAWLELINVGICGLMNKAVIPVFIYLFYLLWKSYTKYRQKNNNKRKKNKTKANPYGSSLHAAQ